MGLFRGKVSLCLDSSLPRALYSAYKLWEITKEQVQTAVHTFWTLLGRTAVCSHKHVTEHVHHI